MLGETDGSGNPIFTQTSANNGSGSINAEGFAGLASVALDTVNHRLFASDTVNGTNRILVFQLDSNNKLVNTVNGKTATNVLGVCNFTSAASSSVTASTFCNISNLVYDSINSRLFVTDGSNNRVLAFAVAPGFSNCENATFVLCQPNFTSSASGSYPNGWLGGDDADYDSVNSRYFVNTSSGLYAFSVPGNATSSINGENALFHLGGAGGATQNGLEGPPTGVAYDSVNDRLFVDQKGGNRVSAFSVPANANSSINDENALFVIGQPNFTSNNTNQLSGPDDLSYDATNNRLFVSDGDIIIWNVPSNATSSFNGTPASGDISGNTYYTQMSSPESAASAYDPTHNMLYVYEGYGHRIFEFDMVHITTSSLSAGTTGTPYSQTISSVNSQGSLSYSVSSGSLPNGLSLNFNTGVLSGTPTTPGTYNFTVEADDTYAAEYLFDRATYALTVNSPTATTFTLTGPSSGTINSVSSAFTVTPDTSYTFTVIATNSVGSSIASAPSNNITPSTTPDAPTIGTATAGNASATVTFSANGTGGSTITGYTVTSIPSGGTDSNAGSTSLSHVMTGLANGTSYTFTVHATNNNGNSAESSPSNSTTPTSDTNQTPSPSGGAPLSLSLATPPVSNSVSTSATNTGNNTSINPTTPTQNITPTSPTDSGCIGNNLFSITTGHACPQNSNSITAPGIVTTPESSGTSTNNISPTCSTQTKTTTTYNFGKTDLKLGNKGTNIKELQTFLNKALGIKLSLDGNFGRNTETAVQSYQKRNCLILDGIVGAQTKAKMRGE